MERRLITQKQLEEKYREDHTTVVLALQAMQVPIVDRQEGRHRCFLYDEDAAVRALIGLYAGRAEGMRAKAKRWDDKARGVMTIYLGKKDDPSDGLFLAQEEMEEEY